MKFSDIDTQAAYHCAAAVIRSRQRTGAPIPEWLRRHYSRLDTQIRGLSESGHESGQSDCVAGQSNATISAREAAAILECSKRQVQRLAADIGGEFICGRWLFKLAAVKAYKEEK
jgi:hypothetical protein